MNSSQYIYNVNLSNQFSRKSYIDQKTGYDYNPAAKVIGKAFGRFSRPCNTEESVQ